MTLLNQFNNVMDFMVLTNFKHGIIITLWYDQVHFRDIFWKPSKVFLHNRNPVCLYFFILICYSCQKSVGIWLSHDIDFNVTEGHKLFKSLGYERSASSDGLLRVISSHDYTFDYFKNLIWSDKHCILEKWNNRAPKFISS